MTYEGRAKLVKHSLMFENCRAIRQRCSSMIAASGGQQVNVAE